MNCENAKEIKTIADYFAATHSVRMMFFFLCAMKVRTISLHSSSKNKSTGEKWHNFDEKNLSVHNNQHLLLAADSTTQRILLSKEQDPH